MTNWYLRVQRLLRAMRRKAADALFALDDDPDADTTAIKTYLKADYDELWREWSNRFPGESLGNLGRHIHFGHKVDYFDILRIDLPELEQRADDHLRTTVAQPTQLGYEHLLHTAIAVSSSALAASGQLREAVLNSITAVFDLMRRRTGLDLDGDALATRVLSLDRPLLVLSELETQSGRNDQAGFMQILQGAYKGIRNPKAHSLDHDLDETKAAQYLVFASLLARRLSEAALLRQAS
jgi:uncharacterized protein (TIGR02391 family)